MKNIARMLSLQKEARMMQVERRNINLVNLLPKEKWMRWTLV